MVVNINGYECLIDDEDIVYILKWAWKIKLYKNKLYLIRSTNTKKKGNIKEVKYHRFIMDTPNGYETDHINGNTLDNRKCNLRICTKSENQCNRGCCKTNKIRLKGVSFHKRVKKWVSQIQKDKIKYHIGYYDTPEEAYVAYMKMAKTLHGEYAHF